MNLPCWGQPCSQCISGVLQLRHIGVERATCVGLVVVAGIGCPEYQHHPSAALFNTAMLNSLYFMQVKAAAQTAVLVKKLRSAWVKMMDDRVKSPMTAFSDKQNEILATIVELIMDSGI